MHLEILVEDLSGKIALESLVPKIIGLEHSFTVHSYRGIGRIPRNLHPKADAKKRILLDQLPRILQGYGRTLAAYPASYQAAVIVVCDLDDRCLKSFREELLNVVSQCTQAPSTKFCIAVEEVEAWFLGDQRAITKVFPRAKGGILAQYANDSICGTWECLANAIYTGGAAKLAANAYRVVGSAKCEWASKIAPHMDVETNSSPSFIYFRESLRSIVS